MGSRGMSVQPDLGSVLREHRERIRALEANAGGGLEITDGTIDIPRASQLKFDPDRGIVLTNPGSGPVAEVDLDVYHPYTPVLTAVGTDPTLGIGGGVSGEYTQLGDFVHAWGQILFGGGATIGTGTWEISLPVPTGVAGSQPIGRAYLGANLLAPGGNAITFDCLSAPTVFVLGFVASFPIGTWTYFDDTSGWTLNSADTITWELHYAVA